MFIVLAHWAEHLAQAYQVYVLGWPRPRAGGFLGLFFPWLVSSELMHYGYAIVMLVGLWTLRKGFSGTSRKWWTIALVIQFWHHIEHAVLQWQALTHDYWFGSPVPVSFLQMLLPKFRVEIHLFYNAVAGERFGDSCPGLLTTPTVELPTSAERTVAGDADRLALQVERYDAGHVRCCHRRA